MDGTRSAAADPADLQHAPLVVCAALAEGLVALGVQDHVGIFSDGPAPDRPFLRDNLERYVATAPGRGGRGGLLRRFRGRGR